MSSHLLACLPGSQAVPAGVLITLAALARKCSPVASSPDCGRGESLLQQASQALASPHHTCCPCLYFFLCQTGLTAEPTSQPPCVYEMNVLGC